MPNITVRSSGKPISSARSLPITLDLPTTATILQVKQALKAKFPRLSLERQKLSTETDRKTLDDHLSLVSLGFQNGGVLVVKDLGPQLGWRLVYFIEYLGPLFIHPLFFYGQNVIYRYKAPFEHSTAQILVYYLCMLHFIKRELETLLGSYALILRNISILRSVHRFSHSTMPFRNIFRNSAHYWLAGGVLVAFVVYSPSYGTKALRAQNARLNNLTWLVCWTLVWLWAEVSNFITHITLRNLRPAGTKVKGIPYGYGFGFVSCPNYMFEIIGWLALFIMTGSWAFGVFLAIGGVTMGLWAQSRHRAYKKEFGSKYPKNRKALIPFMF